MSLISRKTRTKKPMSIQFTTILKEENSKKNNDFTVLFSDCQKRKYKLNEVLFTLVDSNSNIFFLKSGKVKVTKISDKGRQVSAGYFQQGDFINLEAITDNADKKITAISKSKDTIAICIKKIKFIEKLSTRTDLQVQIFTQILSNKAEAEQRIHRILDIKSNERVFDFFYHHTLKFGQRVGYEYVIREPLTHREIGEYIGSSRQTVTTSMNILRRKGILHFNRKYWIIRDLNALKKLVDGL